MSNRAQEPLRTSLTDTLIWMAGRCRARFRSAQSLSVAFKVFNLAILAPLATLVLHLCLSRWGRASVGNFEIAAFLLSPAGLAALLGVGAILLASLYLELAGLMHLLADDRLAWWQAFWSSTHWLHRLVQLGLWQLAWYLALAVPFLAAIGLVYWRLWSGQDLNGLIILKPPEFWWGAGLAAAAVAIYLALAGRWFLRWLLAVPILIFEPGGTVRTALATSALRTRGRLWRSVRLIVLWAAAMLVLAAAVLGLSRWGALETLNHAGSSLSLAVSLTAAALAIHAVAAMLVSILANITFAGVVLSLYRETAPAGTLSSRDQPAAAAPPLWTGRAAGMVLAAVAVLNVAVGVYSLRKLKLHESLEITAHRAGATGAPENTVAALQQAIADGADWAELDVQLTADKALVVMHDTDLARVGGGSRPVSAATLAEIRALDVGAPFGPQFAGERIPTLQEFLAAAGDRMRLNVELKPHGKLDAQELTPRVIEEIRRAGMIGRCRLCSQSYESLQQARQIEPQLKVGYIVATAVGDPTELDVDFLMVKSNLATRSLVERAQAHGLAVHAWTVNDPVQVAPLLDAGVANLITDDPARMRARLDEIRALDAAERLLLRARHAFAR